MSPSWPWSGRYAFGAIGGWALFLACVFAVALGRSQGWPLPALIALALVPAATVALQFRSAYRLIARQDEFVRALIAKRMILAAGVSIALVTAWSVSEMVGAPHLPAWLVYPLFWGAFGVVSPLVRASTP